METQQLLESMKIHYVLYVDDAVVCKADDYYDKYLNYVLQGYGKVEFPFEAIEPDREHIMISLDGWWKNASEQAKLDELKRFSICNTRQIDEQLKTYVPEGVFVYCTPEQFKDKFNEISPKETPLNVLILMDKELGNGRDGMDLLQEYKDDENVYCALFSNRIGVDEELKFWEDSGYNSKIFPLAKQRLDSKESFNEGVRNVLYLRLYTTIKNDYIDILRNAVDRVKNDLSVVDPVSLDHAIIRRSADEGCWEFKLLQQMSDALMNYHIAEILCDKYSDFQEYTSLLKNSTTLQNMPFNEQMLTPIREKELFTIDRHINQIYSPISNGDVFSIGGSEYILLFQPCSLAIRGDGTRIGKIGYLVPIEVHTPDKDVTNIPEYRYDLHEASEKKKRTYAILNKYVVISLDVLDLCAYNKEGLAYIDVNSTVSSLENANLMQGNLLVHFESLCKVYKDIFGISQRINSCAINDEIKESLINDLLKHNEMTMEIAPMSIEGTIVKYNIKRVKRYNSHIANSALRALTIYMSRPANTVDFSHKKK